jgi:hypothetical protein
MEVTMVFALGVLAVRVGMLVSGVLFCWFGYRLFAQATTVGHAEISVKDLLKLNLHHVGPGVFFSLFGAAILVYGIHKAPTLETHDQVPGTPTATGITEQTATRDIFIAGMKSEGARSLDDKARQLQIREQIAFTNRVAEAGTLSAGDQVDLARLTRDIKLSLMQMSWNASWGDYAEFEAWALDPSSRTPNAAARAVFDLR